MSQKITPCLWFDGDAEEAAKFYVSLLPGSQIDEVFRSPVDTPSGKAGSVLTVEFTLAGMKYLGLNGGSNYSFNQAVSFQIHCDNQEEVDRLWNAIKREGKEIACGWITISGAYPGRLYPSVYLNSSRTKIQNVQAARWKQ